MRKMPSDSVDLLDVNVWLSLADPAHTHHERAKEYWYQESATRIAFCRVTMLGFWRLATNPKAMSGEPFTAREAWQVYRGFRALDEVTLIAEPEGLEEVMAEWSERGDFLVRHWTDCCLGAWASLSGCRLVSFDRAFAAFDGLDFLHLK